MEQFATGQCYWQAVERQDRKKQDIFQGIWELQKQGGAKVLSSGEQRLRGGERGRVAILPHPTPPGHQITLGMGRT